MIVYVDSSVIARSYLSDEPGHDEAARLLSDPAQARITGSWTRIEVSSAVVRAARAGRADEVAMLALLDADLGPGGRVSVVEAPPAEVEAAALRLVGEHGIRAMDAWHLATAALTLPGLADPDEGTGFASRDVAQSSVAETLGLQIV